MQERDFAFNTPVAAFLILWIVPLILMQIYLFHYRRHKINAFSQPSLLATLLIGRSSLFTFIRAVGWSVLWLLACLALMNPIGNLRYRHLGSSQNQEEKIAAPQYRPHEVLFLVDTSASMSVPDAQAGQTRLDQAKEIMEDVIRQLKGPTVALDAFTTVLTPIVPPTLDYLFVRLMIKSLHFDEGDVGGTLYEPVLAELVKKELSNPSNKLYSLVILSDGGDTQIEKLKGEERTKAINKIANIFPNPEEYHLRVFTVGIGSTTPQPIPNTQFEGKPVTSSLQSDLLKAIANRNRGDYFEAQNEMTWNLAQNLVTQIMQDPPLVQRETGRERKVIATQPEDIIYDLYFQIPLGIAIFIFLMNFILPDVRRS